MSSDPILKMARVFEAPVSRVFAAWIDPKDLEKWAWGDLGVNVRAEVDSRVGGRYRIETSRPDHETWVFSGTYLEIIPDKRLVYTLKWDAPMGYEVATETLRLEFTPRGETTEVSFLHEGVPDERAREVHEQGWSNTFDTLDRILRASNP